MGADWSAPVKETMKKYTPITDSEAAQLDRDSAKRLALGPTIESVRYDRNSGRFELMLRKGVALGWRARDMKGLEVATDAELDSVTATERGTVLEVPSLDQQYQLSATLQVLLQMPTVRSLAAAAGRATSPAKAASARANGARGGRPRNPRSVPQESVA